MFVVRKEENVKHWMENHKRKLEWMNKRVNVFKRCCFWYFVSDDQFLRLFEIILRVTFLFRSSILSAFIQWKSELNFTLFFEVLQGPFWLFCKLKKTKTARGLLCFLIKFAISIERLWCAESLQILKRTKVQSSHLLMSY